MPGRAAGRPPPRLGRTFPRRRRGRASLRPRRSHGALCSDPRPFRTDDITTDPRFRGWWPDAHPRMRSFLGVPIVAKGDIIGAFYLTEKDGAAEFDDADEKVITVLAAHAAIAIENAPLFEPSR